MFRKIVIAALVSFGALPVLAAPMTVEPIAFPIDVSGVEVVIKAGAQLEISTQADGLVVTADIVGDLSDLQAKALPIAQTIDLPRERCANKNGANVVVDSIDAASITAEGNAARLKLAGHITGHACIEQLGISANTVIGTADATIAALIVPDVGDGSSFGLALAEPVDVGAEGFAGDVLSLLDDHINGRLSEQLEKSLDGSRAAASLPDLPDLVLKIESASFADAGGKLMLNGRVSAKMSAATFAALLSSMQK